MERSSRRAPPGPLSQTREAPGLPPRDRAAELPLARIQTAPACGLPGALSVLRREFGQRRGSQRASKAPLMPCCRPPRARPAGPPGPARLPARARTPRPGPSPKSCAPCASRPPRGPPSSPGPQPRWRPWPWSSPPSATPTTPCWPAWATVAGAPRPHPAPRRQLWWGWRVAGRCSACSSPLLRPPAAPPPPPPPRARTPRPATGAAKIAQRIALLSGAALSATPARSPMASDGGRPARFAV